MVCSFCGEENNITGEHLIPQGLLDLFAECDYNIQMKETDNEDEKIKIFKGDRVVINDVCNICNNGILSQLDTYGIQLIKKYFQKEYLQDDVVNMEYDYGLLTRWILKVVYNNARAFKKDYVSWFSNKREYILKGNGKFKFSVFSGLAIDMSPLPEFFFYNTKLLIMFDPLLISGSLLMVNEGFTNATVSVNPNNQKLNLSNVEFTCLLRFGSLLLYVIFWDERADEDYINNTEKLINMLYPYNLVKSMENTIYIERVTHAYNYHKPHIIDTNVGMSFADRTNSMLPPDITPLIHRKKYEGDWPARVQYLREQKQLKKKKKKKKRRK